MQRQKFTEMWLRNLRPQEKKFDVPDEVRGLFVRVLPSGTKTFYFTYSFRGRNRFYRIGPFDGIGIAEARRRAKQLIARVANDEDPQAEKRAKRSAGTWRQLHQRYVEEHAKRNNRSWQVADRLVRIHAKRWDSLGPDQITKPDVRQVFNSVAAPIMANRVKASISAVFGWAVKQDILTVNPCKGIDSNKEGDRERILSDSEVPVFWNACNGIDPVKAKVLRVLLLTGQRSTEVSRMRWEHIKDGRWWEMPGAKVPELRWPGTKNKRSHRIWLSRAVMELIGTTEAKSGFVFATERGSPVDNLDRDMRSISQRLDSPPVVPHDLRRSFASRAGDRGHSDDAIERLLNHKLRLSRTVRTYIRSKYFEENRRIMEDVANAFMDLVEGRRDDNVVVGEFRR
jgi:integrase